MIAVTRYRVPPDQAESFAVRARGVLAGLSAAPATFPDVLGGPRTILTSGH